MTKIYAIVPIKHVSTRVPGKNYRLMNDYPLYYYVIKTLLISKYISKIYIDTNSDVIKSGVVNYFGNDDKIIIYDRPEHLHDGNISTNVLLQNIINDLKLDADCYFQTHVTNPLLQTDTIDNAIHTFINSGYDSLFSVTKHQTRLYDKNGCDMNHNRFNLIPTQDLDPIYEENSCMYLFTKKTLNNYNARIGSNALLYEIGKIEASDIDWEEDFILAEQLMKLKCMKN